MTVDGWSRDGTSRLVCFDPSEQFVPNVFLGMPFQVLEPPDPPELGPFENDFSLEVWSVRKFGQSPGADELFFTGLAQHGPDPQPSSFDRRVGILWFDDGVVSARFDVAEGAPAEITEFVTPTQLGYWHHVAITYDRDGDMEIFVDGISRGTEDISSQADALFESFFYPLTDGHFFAHHGDFTDWTVAILPVIVGPIALHNGLLTTSQIQSSYRNRTIVKDSNTIVAYEWDQIEGASGWDRDMDRLMLGHKAGLSIPAAAPLGESGEVYVVDASGNENHWFLPISTDWSTFVAPWHEEEDGRWPYAFGVDPFFR